MLQCRPAQEFSLGPRALKDALVSTDPALQQLYMSAFSPAERLFLAEAYSPQRTLFCTPFIHTAFDWLLSRPEAPEDFETFHAALLTRRRGPARKHIYLQPIGTRVGGACTPCPRGLGVHNRVKSWRACPGAIRTPLWRQGRELSTGCLPGPQAGPEIWCWGARDWGPPVQLRL